MSTTSDPVLGIDLATTFSVVATFRNGTVEVFSNDQGNKSTPSCVAFTDSERLVGDAAKNQAAMNPQNTIYDIKRLIGRKFSDRCVQEDIKLWPFRVVPGDNDKPLVEVSYRGETKRFSAEELSAMILSEMKRVAETCLGTSVKKAVITVPAYFNDGQRQATKDAAIIAGLEPLRIVNEPTAAALCYGLENKSATEQNILVFDLGGGTFDVSILTLSDGVFEVRSTGGNTHLGGEDFDNRLVQFCLNDINKRFKRDLNGQQRALKRLKIACERAKRTLTSTTNTTIEVDSLFDGQDYTLSLTRARFEDLCGDLFRSTLNSVEQVLRDSQLDKKQIHEVVLVGGSTRIPYVQKILSDYFHGKDLCRSIDPDLAVAWGAAVQGAIITGNKDESIKDLVLLDVCPLSLGVETSGQIMTVIIPRNTSLPTRKAQMFSTYSDNQTAVTVRVFEGERQFTKDNNSLGTFELQGLPPMPRGVPKIEIVYEIDTNGILTVTANEQSNKNNVKKIVIDNKKGRLSKDEIDRMVQDASLFEKEDQKKREVLEAKQKVETMLYAYRNQAQEQNKDGKMKDQVEEIQKVVREGLDWLESHSNETVEVYEKKQTELETKIGTLFQSPSTPDASDPYAGTNPFAKSNPDIDIPSAEHAGPTVEELD